MKKASCSCGNLWAKVSGEMIRHSLCHCLACQKRTGTVFGTQARFHAKDVRTGGESTLYTRHGDDGLLIDFHFCPTCGSTVYYKFRDHPEMIAIPTGAFGDSSFSAPKVSVYNHRKHSWVVLPENCTLEDPT